jgi:hypothetical protein
MRPIKIQKEDSDDQRIEISKISAKKEINLNIELYDICSYNLICSALFNDYMSLSHVETRPDLRADADCKGGGKCGASRNRYVLPRLWGKRARFSSIFV